MFRIYFLAVCLLSFCFFSVAVAQGVLSPADEQKSQEIFKELRCVVCSGQPLSESEASIAIEMRSIIRQQVSEGKDSNEIIDWLRQRYGDAILRAPFFSRFSWPLYVIPPFIIFLAIFLLPFRLWLARRKNKEV